jgi:Tol biopolymer transport system component/predicted Ser/Thr protein kinase
MSLTSGERVGPYEVVSLLGTGGMGEVYRARDARLNRDVAIKVLRGDCVDQEGLPRFAREAQSLAALNHPHIAQIYGLEDNALVMELVEGDDLSGRLVHGPLAIDDAIAIARQIAEALESAHDVGIVHRDLKPANVKVRGDGTVKVLDFGLAKVWARAASGEDVLNSPTIASPAMTAPGIILGTAAYMSPEQARGRPVDKRADIWAFGVVLYEMLSGRRAFPGDTITDVIAAVITREPDWSALPDGVPPRVRELLQRCLEKDPRLRLRDIGEARIVLGMPHAHAHAAAPAVARTKFQQWLPWALAALTGVAAVAAWMLKPIPAGRLQKMELSLPATASAFTLSPDGRSIAYFTGGVLWVRDLAALEPRQLTTSISTGQRMGMVWSPDSSSIGYNTADSKYWVIAARGGAPLQVCTIPETGQLMGALWRRDGSIVLAVWRGNLYQVPAGGGEPRALLTIDPSKEVDFHSPVALPDGRLAVSTHLAPRDGIDPGYTIEVIDGVQRQPILAANVFQPFAYVEAGYFLAQRYDANQGIWALPYKGSGSLRADDAFAVAPGGDYPTADARGTLLYSLAPGGEQMRELVWVDRAGRVIGQIGSAVNMSSPALSPDGTRVAFSARVDNTRDIWVRDVKSGADTRVSFEADDEVDPIWFADGRRVAYHVARSGVFNVQLVMRDAGGGSERKDLAPAIGSQMSRDGRYLAFYIDERGRNRLRYATVSADGQVSTATPLFTSSEPEAAGPTFSPDGRLLAYVERQPSGNMEVFVTRFPSGEGRLQVSVGGGRAPLWGANGELFFLAGATASPKQMMAVRIGAGDTLRAGAPMKLFDVGAELDASDGAANFDVSKDGKEFLMLRRVARDGQSSRWVLVQNWPAEFALRPAR